MSFCYGWAVTAGFVVVGGFGLKGPAVIVGGILVVGAIATLGGASLRLPAAWQGSSCFAGVSSPSGSLAECGGMGVILEGALVPGVGCPPSLVDGELLWETMGSG